MEKKRNILFLGGCGFLGRNVIHFHNEHRPVAGPPLHFMVVGRKEPGTVPGNCTYIQTDYSDTERILSIIRDHGIHEVFHFGGASFPHDSNDNILSDIESELVSTVKILDAAKRAGVNRITYLSSAGTVYGESDTRRHQEDVQVEQRNSYGILKSSIESYIRLYSRLYGMDHLILRVTNPFGPYHTNEKNGFINVSLRKIIRKQPVSVWGDGTTRKDFIYSVDFARMFWDIQRAPVKNQVLNVASGMYLSLNDLISVFRGLGLDFQCIHENSKSFDTRHLEIRTDKLRSMIGGGVTPIETAVADTYAFELASMARSEVSF